MTAVVELVDASKTYGRVKALKNVSLEVRSGEVVAILGPNGAGKTTSISLMLGLRRPSSGTARLFGMNPRSRRARSRCGVMLQESGLPAALKVREVVDLFRSYYPSPLALDAAIQMAGLEEKADSQIGKLSGGQRQRLYYALAVCGDPEVLFLDEPSVGMDVEGRHAFLKGISGLAAEGKTIVLTTHYLEEADQLARRVVVIDRGSVIADDTPARIKARVAGKRVSFRTAAPLHEAAFEDLPVTALELRDGQVRFLSSEPESVLRSLFLQGAEIEDLEVTGAHLEEAFLSLTARGKSS